MKEKKGKVKWRRNMPCPVCGKTVLGEWGDICEVCFWENDPFQFDEPDSTGANHLSLNNYKLWWAKLEQILPVLIEKYGIGNSKVFAPHKYNNLAVPRENIVPFINELSGYGIKIEANFYNVCKQYAFDSNKFHGFVWSRKQTPKENNDEILNLIFTKNPVKACEEYKLIQLLEILNKSENKVETWEKLTPNIDISPNPKLEDLEYLLQ